MTTLATDAPRDFEIGDHNDLPAIAGDIIYEGAAVGLHSSGYARPLVAGDVFGGFALRQVDNALGAAGEKNVRVIAGGAVVLPVTGLTIDDFGKPIYASDDNTFTMTASTNTQIGTVKRFISNGRGVVDFSIPRAPANVSTADIGAGAVTLAKLADGIKPSHIVVFAGEVTWSGSGATLNHTVTGALETDIVVATIASAPTQAAYLKEAAISATNTLALELSAANSGNDAVIAYTVLRAVA
jgi:hypothetical protein